MATPTADASVGVSAERFGWPLARLACSVHESFTWNGSAVDRKNCFPLGHSWGERHRLSLLAQYAAHQSFLTFAGLADAGVDPEEWAVVKSRATDVRLVRIGSRRVTDWSGETGFDHVLEFAREMSVTGLVSLERPWARPDHVYAEARERLREGSAGSLSVVARSAFGVILSPGPLELDRMLSSPSVITRDDGFRAVRNFAKLSERALVTIGGRAASPLSPGSGLADLDTLRPELASKSPETILDALAEIKGLIFIIQHPERLDRKSRTVVERLADEGVHPIVGGAEATSLFGQGTEAFGEPSSCFVVSPSAESMRQLMIRLSTVSENRRLGALETFCGSDAYDRYLGSGELPSLQFDDDETISLGEPARSFLAALSLLGEEIDLELASRYLSSIGALVSPLELVREGLTSVEEGRFRFHSERVRRSIERLLPGEMVVSLIGSALGLLEDDRPLMRYRLALRRDRDEALSILDQALRDGRIDDAQAGESLQLDRFPSEELRNHTALATVEAEALFARGRYRSALDLVEGNAATRARLVAARCCRRLGRYEDALAILNTLDASFPVVLLIGVLQRLGGELGPAETSFDAAKDLASSNSDSVRLEFERALLAIDRSRKPKVAWKRSAANICPWLVDRFESYVAIAEGRYEAAAASASRAIEHATELFERVDAHVDLVFSRFMAGAWEDAAIAARGALGIVEETEGDRAGGGLLYILGFLSADDGRWRDAESILRKLETFYDENSDDRRRRELDLIRAQLYLGRLEYSEARRAANRVTSCDAAEIRYAARLILDELDWIAGSLPMLRVDGSTGCAELQRRSALLEARAGKMAEVEGFFEELLQMERAILDGREAVIPDPEKRSERLMLARSLDALERRTGSVRFEETLGSLCEELGIDRGADLEPLAHKFLVALARAEMPPPDLPLAGIDWRFAARNRLGTWQQHGSLSLYEPGQLDTLTATDDVIRIGDSGLLWLEGDIEWTDDLREAIASLWRVKWEHRNLTRLNEQLLATVRDDVPASEDGIIGESVALREALHPIPSAVRSDLAVTIEGESGTGKELVARAIHRRSRRRGRPFTAINCGALPENLIESELFGHVRGAFTGADRDRVGLIEATAGGTLFLDEIGEMPLAAQAKLLRLLQEGEFRRVGETETRTADVRIIAATNRQLEKEVDAGSFRQDLYYRIKGIEITLPPLRRRGNDVMLLARKFLSDARRGRENGPAGFTEDVESLFLGYRWDGNVRDLQNVVLGAFSLAGDSPLITVDHLPQRVKNAIARVSKRGSFYEELAQFRRHLLEQSLLDAGGNQSRAAKSLGMTRQALAYQIKELGIQVRKQR